MTAEEYIKDFTRGCSNELENGEYEYWLTPWQAEAACNLAREEVREQFEKEQLKHCDELTQEYAQIRELADNMYHAAQYLTTDASRLHKTMEEYRQYVINELKEE